MPEWISKYWVEWAFGLIAAGVAGYVKHLSAQVKKERAEQKALRDGMRSLLRRQLILDCEQSIRENFCSTAQKDTIEDMYDAYHALGGNGVVSHLMAQTMNLPTVRGGLPDGH